MDCDLIRIGEFISCVRCGSRWPWKKDTLPRVQCVPGKQAVHVASRDEILFDYLVEHQPITIGRLVSESKCGCMDSAYKTIKEFIRQGKVIQDDGEPPLLSLPYKTVDVVYAIGNGSQWNNNELRYSLRALEKNFPELGQVFIVGEKPDWMTGVVHIPMTDSFSLKGSNIIGKVLAACQNGISEHFVRCSDDEVLLLPTRYHELVPLHNGDMKAYPDSFWEVGGKWRQKYLRNTMKWLAENQYHAYNFDTHTPKAFNRNKFIEITSKAPWQTDTLAIDSLVINASGDTFNSRKINGDKLTVENGDHDIEWIRENMNGKRYLGYNDAGLAAGIKDLLPDMFPEPSRFEKTAKDIVPMQLTQDADTMRIWSFWKGPMPGYVELCQETLRKHCPDARMLTEEEFKDIQKIDRDVDYSHLCLAHQADWVRLNLLYTFGGLWLDADCVVMRPLQRFLDAIRCCWLMSPLEDDELIGGGFIGAPPRSYIIEKAYRRATEIVRSKRQPKWRELLGSNLQGVMEQHHRQGFFCVDWHQIQPLQWKVIRQSMWNPRTDAEHEANLNASAFTYMLVHNKMPPDKKLMTRDEIMQGQYFLSYLFRKSLND